jgi:hypothetical protein
LKNGVVWISWLGVKRRRWWSHRSFHGWHIQWNLQTCKYFFTLCFICCLLS